MISHHTKDKGDLAVLKVQADVCEQGYIVCTPHTEHAPFDLVVYRDGVFSKVQVKYSSLKNGAMQVDLRCTWADKHGCHSNEYKDGDFDVLGIYCPDTRLCYYVPWELCKKTQMVTLRVLEAKGKNRNITRADRFRVFGPVAQRTEQSVSTRKVESLNLSGASNLLFDV